MKVRGCEEFSGILFFGDESVKYLWIWSDC